MCFTQDLVLGFREKIFDYIHAIPSSAGLFVFIHKDIFFKEKGYVVTSEFPNQRFLSAPFGLGMHLAPLNEGKREGVRDKGVSDEG
jgi:hypothetical protein